MSLYPPGSSELERFLVHTRQTEDPVVSNILLVDDRSENLLAMEAILEPLGQNIVKAQSGREALKALLVQEFAVVLLDVQMPGMDGFELANLMKEREKTRHIPIIFVTALHNSEPYISKGYEVGAVDYLFKPFAPDILKAKVMVFVDLYRTTALLRAAERREYEQRLAQMKEEARREQEAQHLRQILRELEFARNIQRSILPATFQLNGTQIYADIQAAREVGGDFYDVIPMYSDSSLVTCIIGDVMGKGMPAAMTMVLALTVLREISRLHCTPLELFQHANERIYRQLRTVDVANNVSASCITLNVETREALYCKAGHEDLIRWSSSRRKVELIAAQGFFLGTFEDGQFEQKKLQLDAGDKLVLYTDGITDARNLQGELFGLERLIDLVGTHGSESVDALGSLITGQVSAFQQGREQADDIALVILEVV